MHLQQLLRGSARTHAALLRGHLADDWTSNAAPACRQVAALVLASYTSLRPWLRDEHEVLKVGMAGRIETWHH